MVNKVLLTAIAEVLTLTIDFKKYSGHLPQTIMFQIEAEINLDSVQV